MAKKRVVILALGGALLIAGSLLVLKNSLDHLPPGSVKPNSKPAVAQVYNKSSMKVNAQPASQALSVVTSSSASKSLASPDSNSPVATTKSCAQTASSAKSLESPAEGHAAPTAALLNQLISGTTSAPKTILGSGLQTNLLDVAGGLNE